MFTLYLIRHGETVYNVEGLMQGACDSPLTESGRGQCVRAGKALSHIRFDAAFCGDLGRHVQTAELILSQTRHARPALVQLPGLREWNFGGYEARPNQEVWQEIFSCYGLQFDNTAASYQKIMDYVDGFRGLANVLAKRDPSAECYDDILKRMQAAMQTIADRAEQLKAAHILAVSSGNLIRTMVETIAPGRLRDEWFDNCSLSVLTWQDGTFTLQSVSDTNYMLPF